MKPYLNLSISARGRLERLRNIARHSAANWRDMRVCGFHNWHSYCGGLSAGTNSNAAKIWATMVGPYFKRECFADECSDAPNFVRRNKGWYSDSDLSETARGIVARLSHGRFLAGFYWSMNGERVYESTVYDNERDAAIAADACARIFAERESDYQRHWREAEDLRSKVETSIQRLRECLALRHKECMDYVREEIPQLIASIRDAREKLSTDYKDCL